MRLRIRMKQTLRDVWNILLVVLCDYVLGEIEYFLLERPSHIALSNDIVYTEYNYQDNDTSASKMMSITLLNISNNETIVQKHLPVNQSQGVIEFECFYFVTAGHYQFIMSTVDEKESSIQWRSSVLNVSWPMFHIDLNRTLNSAVNSLLVGVFTNEQLCPVVATELPVVSIEIKGRNSLHDLVTQSPEEAVLKEVSKTLSLSRAQWVEFDCVPKGQEVFVFISLKSLRTRSVISSTGPIDLVKSFGYKLVVANKDTCDSLVVVHVVPPPCTLLHGKIVVYKEVPRRSGESITALAETVIYPGNDNLEMNCTLFELGINKYCFEFFMVSTKSHFYPRAKECVVMRRNIEAWGMWQTWSPCSVTCGDGIRERSRRCLTSSTLMPGCIGTPKEDSLCSLDDCSTVKPSGKPSLQPEREAKSNNTVTVTGISLCLFIIIATVVFTVWRRLCHAQKCRAPDRHNTVHSPSFRKNSDLENICQHNQMRESISEGCEAPLTQTGQVISIPLINRRSLQLGQEAPPNHDSAAHDRLQDTTQKIIPPIFGYRLAQQQLKEMKKKGLTETTKVYHVCQNPVTDTLLGATIMKPPLAPESSDEASNSQFRIKSPFVQQSSMAPTFQVEKPNTRSSLTSYQAKLAQNPGQPLTRLSHLKHQDLGEGQFDKSYRRSTDFRRTSSFHETKQPRPFRERSMTTLSPKQTAAPSFRSKTWDRGVEERFRPTSRAATQSTEKIECSTGTRLTREALDYFTKYHNARLVEKDLGLFTDHQISSRAARTEKSEPSRARKGPSATYRNSWRQAEESNFTPKDSYQRCMTLSPSQYRRDKCQSFPRDPECAFYDNTSFGLTEAEQRMIDLPGYFGSNEEDETSTLSIEKLVI
ncbi:thrombospondin type-1 domain-containing protein 1 [Ambystoma mexicanum]|uniref:thrombospondin type-1 domain-containing protein 1 n=1 Tax=Ambystoma mexicanum TaxID=8296 RepID=UPI0037E9204C